VSAGDYADERFGVPTITDILRELVKPGRDVRPEFKAARFADGINELKDLKPGLVLEGKVTNVAAFGAFVDIGVHQDGLVHISNLAAKFVKDPRDVVKAGDIVKVKVLEVDLKRNRVQLTMRLNDTVGDNAGGERRAEPARANAGHRETRPAQRPPQHGKKPPQPPQVASAMAAAFAKLGK
jgi:protein Tex